MSSLNVVTIIGNLGRDPEIRAMPDGTQVANLNVACSDQWIDKQSGEKRERTEWIRCVLFGPVAGVAEKYLRKGSKCYLAGRLQTRKYQDQSGQDRYSTEVVVDRGGKLLLLDSKRDNASRGGETPPASGELDEEIPF